MQPRISENQLKQWAVGDDQAAVQFLKQIVLNFAGKIPATLSEMDTLLSKSEYLAIAKHAHQLKGTAGNLGLMLLHDYFMELENASKSGSHETIAHWIKKSKEELPQTLDEFHQIKLG